MSTLIYTHTDCLEHRPGPGHPESPARLEAVLKALQGARLDGVVWGEAPLGTAAQVQLVHTPQYLRWVESLRPEDGYQALDAGDTVISPGSWNAVMRCVGAACAGVDDVVEGRAANVFCATRPCGHHAEADRAMGFCVFNQAAIAAMHAQRAHGLQKVAVVDFDVHHGNGTQNSFFRHPDLFYGSCHQAPFYPGTGARHESGVAGNIVNVPLPRGCGSAMFRERMGAELLPALRHFAPELLIISAGFDAHQQDPLGGLEFTDDDYHWITRELMDATADSSRGRVVSVLEGGYSLEGLASGCVAHVRALRGH
ncbi:MAG: histone deacetylase family protein [Burkholderiales bacterium]|nr:histone deacetylase family protein [Burkholderiales bacterium]